MPVADDRVTPLVEELSPVPDPVHCCEQLAGLPYRLFLDSAATATRLGRYSFLTADPTEVIERKGSSRALTRCGAAGAVSRRADHRAFRLSGWRGRLSRLRLGAHARASAGAQYDTSRARPRHRHLPTGCWHGSRCVACVADSTGIPETSDAGSRRPRSPTRHRDT